MKTKAAEEVGVAFQHVKLPRSTTEDQLLKVIKDCNEDEVVHAILLQLPLESDNEIGESRGRNARVQEEAVCPAKCTLPCACYILFDDSEMKDFSSFKLLASKIISFLDSQRCTDAISVDKDVDGLTLFNAGRLARGDIKHSMIPCTPLGALELINRTGTSIEGKRAVVVGRSKIVVSCTRK